MLERNNIRYWIAPRDVLPGVTWGSAIVAAIQSVKVCVLVFSGAANQSPQIERGIERAINKGIPVVPFRIGELAERRMAGSVAADTYSCSWQAIKD